MRSTDREHDGLSMSSFALGRTDEVRMQMRDRRTGKI